MHTVQDFSRSSGCSIVVVYVVWDHVVRVRFPAPRQMKRAPSGRSFHLSGRTSKTNLLVSGNRKGRRYFEKISYDLNRSCNERFPAPESNGGAMFWLSLMPKPRAVSCGCCERSELQTIRTIPGFNPSCGTYG